MTTIRQSVMIDAPPEDVWEIISNPRNLPKWNKHILSVYDVPENGLRAGAKYWTEMGGFGVRVRVRAEVKEIDPPRYSRIQLTGPLTATVRTWIRPAGKSRTRLEHQVDYSVRGGPVGALVGRALRTLGGSSMLKRGIRAQKRQAERS